MKLDSDEKEILGSVERGEWRSSKEAKRDGTRYSRYAKATFSQGPSPQHPHLEQRS